LEVGLLYILAGPDDFSLNQSLEEIKKGLGDAATLATCTTILDGQQVTADELKQICATVPFLAEKRLVIIYGLIERSGTADKSKKTRTAKPADQETNAFASCLSQLPESTVVVMIENEAANTLKQGLFQELSPKAVVRTFALLKEARLKPWIQKRVADIGASISQPAIDLLCRLIGSNLWVMANEIDKLVLYVNDRRIEEQDVKLLVGYAQDVSVFTMIDAIVDFKVETAGQLLQQLLRGGAAPAYLLYMLDRQFRMIIRAKELKAQGKPEAIIQTKLGLYNEFALKRTLDQAGRYSSARLKQIYRQLLETDMAIKTGRYESEIALELLITGLTDRGQKAITTRIGA
jgi:DNA polymerase-3 subunit delta